MMKNTTKSLHD